MSDPTPNDHRSGRALRIAAIFAIAAAMFTVGYTTLQGRVVVRYLAEAGAQHRLAQRLHDLTRTAAPARAGTYTTLDMLRGRLEAITSRLGSGGREGGFLVLPGSIRRQIGIVEGQWDATGQTLDAFLDTRATTQAALSGARIIASALPRLTERLDELVQVLVRNGAERRQIHVVARQLMLAQRITGLLQGLAAGRLPRPGTLDQFGRDVALYGQVLEGLGRGGPGLDLEPLQGPEARARLREAQALYPSVSEQANAILAATPTLLGMGQTLKALRIRSGRLLTRSARLTAALLAHDRVLHSLGAIALLLCALAGLARVWMGRGASHARSEADDPP